MLKVKVLAVVFTCVISLIGISMPSFAQDGLSDAIAIINSQQERISQLEAKNSQLTTIAQQLQARVKQLERTNAALASSSSVSAVPAMDDTLKKENESLQAAVERLTKENDNLRQKFDRLEVEAVQLEKRAVQAENKTPQLQPQQARFKNIGERQDEPAASPAPLATNLDEQPEQGKRKIPVSLTVDHWNADISADGSSELDQTFFPAVRALVGVKDRIALEIAMMSSDDAEDAGDRLSTDVTTYGVRFLGKSSTYFSLTKHSVEYNVAYATPIGGISGGTIDVNGFRVAAGREISLSDSWSANLELGYGISAEADVDVVTTLAPGSLNMDGDEFDYDFTLLYNNLPHNLSGRLGYRVIKTDISATGTSLDMELKGLYFGAGYDF